MHLFRKSIIGVASVTIILAVSVNNAAAITANVLNVYDGDTIKVMMGGKKVTIRLYGIDAPERGQHGNAHATRFLTRLILGNPMEIKIMGKDWAGRTQAIVTNLGYEMSVNAAMVANGYAWVHPQTCTTEECVDWKEFESMARRYKLGIWSGYDLIPPWEFNREGN